MPVIRIEDLAEVMIEELAPFYGHDPKELHINVIGTKPGEKMYEELMNGEETRRAWELAHYFVILPAFTSPYRNVVYRYQNLQSKMVTNPYHSGNENPLTKDELRAFLKENHLFLEDPEQMRHPSERFWPNGSDKKDPDVQDHEPMPREKISRIHGTA
jgi:FlaA1/EpsC-like NDP-sugar epimerase